MVTKQQALEAFDDYVDWAMEKWAGKDTSPYEDRKADKDAATVLEYLAQSRPETSLPPMMKADHPRVTTRKPTHWMPLPKPPAS